MRHYHPSFIRQCLVLACGLALAGFGVALTTRAGLGTSPISSLPYVVMFLTPLTFGMTTFVVNVFFVLGQVALSLVLSLVALHAVRGLREGTIVAAFAVGLSLRWLVPLLRPVRRWLFA